MELTPIDKLYNVSSAVIRDAANRAKVGPERTDSFDSVLQGALKMVNETNDRFHDVEEEEVRFELGDALNTHDLQIAQEKANITLQYTMAVRDRVIAAYRELMQMQI